MLTIVGSRDTILPFKRKGHAPNNVFRIGQKIIYEGEEARIIRLSPFPVVKTGSRVICGALLTKIEQVETGRQESV
jgi:hypothetical protein